MEEKKFFYVLVIYMNVSYLNVVFVVEGWL